ncbi:hypothetical protein N0V95_009503, partial [Ascochyta clinopodiicola]
MASSIKVAVIQLYPKPLDPEHNFSKAANYIRTASSQGAELAVLPEYHLTNWLPEDPAFVGLCEQWETGPERAHLTSSTHAPHLVFDTPIGKVGLLICWDLAFPEAFRELIASGAQLI